MKILRKRYAIGRASTFGLLLALGAAQNAYAGAFTFDADPATPGFQAINGFEVDGTIFNLLPVTDPTGSLSQAFIVGTVTNFNDQDWFLFQVSVVSGGPIATVTADIPGASVGVSRLGPGFTPTVVSLNPPTWDFSGFTAGLTSDKLVVAFALGGLPGDVQLSITDGSGNKKLSQNAF